MADKRPVHTVKTDNGWGNRRAGSGRISKEFGTKAEAEKAGRTTAKNSKTEHISHGRDGKIGGRRSYGNDPHPPKDKR